MILNVYVADKKMKRLDSWTSTQILTFLRVKRDIFLFSPFFRIWSRALSFDQNYRNIDVIRGYDRG